LFGTRAQLSEIIDKNQEELDKAIDDVLPEIASQSTDQINTETDADVRTVLSRNVLSERLYSSLSKCNNYSKMKCC